jgi:hypothetical protein
LFDFVLTYSTGQFATYAFDGEYMEDTSNYCSSWKKDPSRKFYLLLMKIYKKLKSVHPGGQHEYLPGASLYEKNLVVYSKEYVDYFLCKHFQMIRKGNDNRDNAMIWVTKHWRQRQGLGAAMRMSFSDELNVAPVVEVGVVPVINPIVADNVTQYTQDKFWSRINSATGNGPRFSYILILKMMVHKICLGNSAVTRQNTRRRGLTNSSMKNYMKDISSSTGHGLIHFWDTEHKMTTYLKDRLFGNDRGTTNTDMTYVRNSYQTDRDSIQKVEWRLAMKPINHHILIETFENPPEGAIAYELFDDGNSATGRVIGDMLDRNALKEAVERASLTGVITNRLIERLLSFRTSWQRNRRSYGAKCVEFIRNSSGERVSQELCNANVTLSNNFGFYDGDYDVMRENRYWRDNI